jgi:hypothetical protein
VVVLRDRLLDCAFEHRGLAIFIDKTEITVGQRFDTQFFPFSVTQRGPRASYFAHGIGTNDESQHW